MDFENDFTAVLGVTYTSAQYNKYVRDNLNAIFIYEEVGDIVYAISPTALGRLAKPSVDSVFTMSNAGVPAWLAKTALPGRLHTWGIVASSTERTTSSATVSDVTGMSISLSLGVTCTIIALGIGMQFLDSAVREPQFLIHIDGTDNPNVYSSQKELDFSTGAPFHTVYSRTGISSGTRTVKLRFKLNSSGDTLRFKNGVLLALAFAE